LQSWTLVTNNDLLFFCDVETKGDLHADLQGCVWFVDKGGLDIDIHGYRDMDIHIVCLVRWMGQIIFLFDLMNMCWTERAIFLSDWMEKDGQVSCNHHLPKLVRLPLQTCTTAATHVQIT